MACICGVKKKQSMGDSDNNCDNHGHVSQADAHAGINKQTTHSSEHIQDVPGAIR